MNSNKFCLVIVCSFDVLVESTACDRLEPELEHSLCDQHNTLQSNVLKNILTVFWSPRSFTDVLEGSALIQEWRIQSVPQRWTLWKGERTGLRCLHHQSWRRRAAAKSWVLPNWPTGELQFSSSPYSFASLSCLPSPSSFLVPSDHSISFSGTEHSLKQVCTSAGYFGWLTSELWQTCAFSTETYDFLATEDTNRDKVKDILFVLRGSAGSQNNTCTGAGMTCSSHLITQ